MASVRDIFIRLGIKSDPKKLQQINRGLGSIVGTAQKAAVALASFFAFRAVGAAVTKTAALGDSIDKVSSKLGIATDALQEMRFAAGQTGVAQAALDVGLQRFIRRASEASKGTGIAVKALAELGVQVTDVNGKMLPAEQLLNQVADGFSRVETDADRLRLGMKLFDTEGVALINTLKGGSAALEAMREQARQTGGIMDKELIDATVEYTDTAHEFGLVLDGVRNGFMKGLFPVLTLFMERMGEFVKNNKVLVKGLQGWLKTNRELIAGGFVRFLKRLAKVVHSVFSLVGEVVDAIGDWTDSLGPLGRQIFGIVKTVALLAAILLLPGGAILLLMALVGLLIDDFQTWRAGGESAIGDLVGSFEDLTTTVEVYRDAAVATFRDMTTFSAEAKLGIAGVAGAITALAIAVGVRLVAANTVAIASFVSMQAFAVQYYAVLAAGAIRTAAITTIAQLKMAKGWVIAFGPVGLAIATIGALTAAIGLMFADAVEETGSFTGALKLMATTAADFWTELFLDFVSAFKTMITTAMDFWADALGPVGAVIGRFFGGDGQGAPAAATASSKSGTGASIANNQQSTFNMEFNVPVGTDTEALAEMIPPMIAREQEKLHRSEARNFELAAEGAT